MDQMVFEQAAWEVSAFDESNAFTYVLVPRWMWRWQAVPPLRAKLVWEILPEDFKERVTEDTWVYPLYMRLPMGLSHSVHLLMQVNMAAIGRAIRAAARLKELDPVDAVLESLESLDDDQEQPRRSDEQADEFYEQRRGSPRTTGRLHPDSGQRRVEE